MYRIGIPKERLDGEYRVAATPEIVRELREAGYEVYVEKDAGLAVGYSNAAYGEVVDDVWDADLIVKVKQPLPDELAKMREGQILFCYLHLAANPELSQGLIDRKIKAFPYEEVRDAKGRLPLLIPMSQIAGRMAIQAGALSLQIEEGGKGILLGGVPGTPPAKVVILGGGVVGTEAARMALGLGADVTIFDASQKRLACLDELFHVKTRFATKESIEKAIPKADLVIGAVLIPGKKTPRLVPESLVRAMEPGSAIVDVAIDQGGCFETSYPTTHTHPRYLTHKIVHYCVANMPGVVAKTATEALVHATHPYILKLAATGQL